MKLSVIIPVYNSEDYLSECVDSILNQSFKDLEIILVDDGSKDDSPKIIAGYTTRYPNKVRSVRVDNGGQGRARNFGIDMARGEYLGFIDSDDYLENNAFELMLAAADENDADIAVCDLERRFPDGRREYIHAALQDHPLASAGSSSNKIFRRSLVGDIRFPVGVWYEDFAFSAKLLMLSKKTVFVEKPLYIYRCVEQSTMNNNNAKKNLDMISVMEDIKAFAGLHGFEDGFEFLIINHVLLDSLKRLALQDSPDKKEIIGKLRAYVKENIPSLNKCAAYKNETRNRRIIMWLNYHGMEKLSVWLLKLKGQN